MLCPNCKSTRVQRDYDDAVLLARIVGRHRLLCNNCGSVFSGFDPLRKLKRKRPTQAQDIPNRRRAPRYHAHIPAAISLLDENKADGRAVYSEPSRGHCETLNKFGMGLSLVGAKFTESELTSIGRLLFIRLDLPDDSIEAVVTIVNYKRIGEELKRKWFLGVRIQQMSDQDTERLSAYLDRRAKRDSHVVWE